MLRIYIEKFFLITFGLLCGIAHVQRSMAVLAAPQDLIFGFPNVAQNFGSESAATSIADSPQAAQPPAQPQQQVAPSLTASEVNNLPSDLSTNINLLPVNSLIAAAALAETPAPTQFVRTAMNSGLRR